MNEQCQAGACAPRPVPRPAQEPRRVFVTEGEFTGDLRTAGGGLSGIDGANRLCAHAAASANLGGVWLAWISDSSSAAIDRVTEVGPWFLVVPPGMAAPKVFEGKAGLMSDALHAIDRTERGDVRPSPLGGSVWTGDGPDATNTCANWERATGDAGALGGNVGNFRDRTRWSRQGGTHCKLFELPIYCFEQ